MSDVKLFCVHTAGFVRLRVIYQGRKWCLVTEPSGLIGWLPWIERTADLVHEDEFGE